MHDKIRKKNSHTPQEHLSEKKRHINFAKRTTTKIWDEIPLKENPYLAKKCRCHGYDLIQLIQKCRFCEVLFLLFKGELPEKKQTELLESLMISLINPGPRHPATRAAMNAGVGKTHPSHILPIALNVLSGMHLGSAEVEKSMIFLRRHYNEEPEKIAKKLLSKWNTDEKKGDFHIAPGYGSRYGSIDPLPREIADLLLRMPGSGATLKWGSSFNKHLETYRLGWLFPGVAAAVFCDLGLSPQAGAGLFQLFCAPGLLAHGLELASPYKTIADMPFLDEEHYVIAPEAKKRKD